ncbi:MAG: peptide MFS transporter [Sphingomonadales bacterium]|nr:peptide MFS transporter [Sphingomonadales bacterium]PIX65349.1 MAG: hypothetical protein COZ43_09550 [Sphingomonadales bacterium CG_4_10_14_3_um_filter_58_15]NCO49940.1 peptide MFS transporter [Sphingomonadales bacterium]NCP00398.1 peptide MFS transporter [Sphingomonadales bacterium]NCP26778.1 peptide MFS transporter [Sphingomonadales bacterium]
MTSSAIHSDTVFLGHPRGLAYLKPVTGAWIADGWLDPKRTVMIGVIMMTAGHGLTGFEQNFLLAIMLLACSFYFAGQQYRATRSARRQYPAVFQTLNASGATI